MTYPTRHSAHPRFAGPATDDVEGLLRRYFRSELPNPWPACPRLAAKQKVLAPGKSCTVLRFLRQPLRFAVAAAVAGLVLGYVALQSAFPDPKPAMPALLESSPPMGFKFMPGVYPVETRNQRPAQVEIAPPVEPKLFIWKAEELPAKK